MPVEKRNLRKSHPSHPKMVAELVKHLGDDASLPPAPRIIEEEDRLSRSMHVYVFWDEWQSVPEQERSEIILEAYQEARGQQEMLRITVAMGLTPLEAKNLGLAA